MGLLFGHNWYGKWNAVTCGVKFVQIGASLRKKTRNTCTFIANNRTCGIGWPSSVTVRFVILQLTAKWSWRSYEVSYAYATRPYLRIFHVHRPKACTSVVVWNYEGILQLVGVEAVKVKVVVVFVPGLKMQNSIMYSDVAWHMCGKKNITMRTMTHVWRSGKKYKQQRSMTRLWKPKMYSAVALCLCGRAKRRVGVAWHMRGSANERYHPSSPHPTFHRPNSNVMLIVRLKM